MPALVWDKVGDRAFESGIDRGVLYLPDGSVVPWNGLVSVTEKSGKSASPIYFDGRKVQDAISLGDYSATLKAVTYPREFEKLEGFGSIRSGILFADQVPGMFNLSYRTGIGSDLSPEGGYKLHILYNLTAIPSDKAYQTNSETAQFSEFEWEISAIPVEISGFRPTSHVILDSTDIDPYLLADIEDILYGTSTIPPSLISIPELVTYALDWIRTLIVDHGDGTWSAISEGEDQITYEDPPFNTIFKIVGVDAEYSDPDTYTISTTVDIDNVPEEGMWLL